jgi:hypothetical protein
VQKISQHNVCHVWCHFSEERSYVWRFRSESTSDNSLMERPYGKEEKLICCITNKLDTNNSEFLAIYLDLIYLVLCETHFHLQYNLQKNTKCNNIWCQWSLMTFIFTHTKIQHTRHNYAYLYVLSDGEAYLHICTKFGHFQRANQHHEKYSNQGWTVS